MPKLNITEVENDSEVKLITDQKMGIQMSYFNFDQILLRGNKFQSSQK